MVRVARTEYTCGWCGVTSAKPHIRLQTYGRLGWGTNWNICDHCYDWLIQLRGNLRWEDLWAS